MNVLGTAPGTLLFNIITNASAVLLCICCCAQWFCYSIESVLCFQVRGISLDAILVSMSVPRCFCEFLFFRSCLVSVCPVLIPRFFFARFGLVFFLRAEKGSISAVRTGCASKSGLCV
jgi:hypothetical protein